MEAIQLDSYEDTICYHFCTKQQKMRQSVYNALIQIFEMRGGDAGNMSPIPLIADLGIVK